MDELDPVKIEAAVALMRRLGIKRLGSIELTDAPAPVEDAKPATPDELAELLAGPPQGDDALFWSVTGPLPSEARSADKSPQE